MTGPFSYETIADPETRSGFHYRVRDANDDRVATCYLEANAQEVVRLMNLGLKAQMDDIG